MAADNTHPLLPSAVSAVIVTRGDVDLTESLALLDRFDEVVIWNNTLEEDLAVYGRYAGIEQARNDVVFTLDDDCLVSHEAQDILLAAYQPGVIIANMPEGRWDDYPDSCLVGWGAVFDRDLPRHAFDELHRDALVRQTDIRIASRTIPAGEWCSHYFRGFNRECDVVFTTLTPHTKIDAGFTHQPWAEDPARAMFLSPRPDRARMLELARKVRDQVPA